jgi:N-acetylneuraminic acid mutarotase
MNKQTHQAWQHVGFSLRLAVLMTALILVLGTATLASAQAVFPRWNNTGNLNTARRLFTATLLPNGKVLVAGGLNNTNNSCDNGRCLTLNTAELYDPATGAWTFTGNLNGAREQHTATLLPNGKVLVVGGNPYGTPTSAELYDPSTGTWSNTGHLNKERFVHTATLLPNGTVLVAGGYDVNDFNGGPFKSAELYDPALGTWTYTGNLNHARVGTATLLLNGKVQVVGGDNPAGDGKSAELYDPVTGTWSETGSLHTGTYAPLTLLPSGKVLIVENGNTSELYDPATGTWSFTGNLGAPIAAPTATLLSNGKVLTAGGIWAPVTSSAELYDPTTEKWGLTAYLNTSRIQHSATLLGDGRVLVAGGYNETIRTDGSIATNDLKSAELYDPSSDPNTNIIDDGKFFVQQHYFDFLRREPDGDGLAFWTNQMTSCGADAGCQEIKRINVSAAFYLSIEFQETGYFIYRVHKTAYGNLPGAPVPISLDQFLTEVPAVALGVIVGQPGWEEILESNKRYYLFDPDMGSPAGDTFTAEYPTSMTPTQFVDTLFANAGVVPSSADHSAAINEFGSATNTFDRAARVRAFRRVVDNATFRQQEFNRAFVLMQYFGYLHRNPNDPPEPGSNFAGYNFWLNKLNQFNGNFIQAEMVKAFILSAEYRHRFGP